MVVVGGEGMQRMIVREAKTPMMMTKGTIEMLPWNGRLGEV